MNDLNYQRYSRQISLPDLGEEGQKKLLKAKVLIVGAGGLGVPVLQYLSASGIGTIGLVDGDIIQLSNLHRQVIYTEDQVGRSKVDVAVEYIKERNSEVAVIAYNEYLSRENAEEILSSYDIIIDCTDNLPSRYLISDAAVLYNKIMVYGSIYQFEGQVAVFNAHLERERGPNYRDIFPKPPPANWITSCAEGGVLGVLPGIVGSVQALEAIKLILGIPSELQEKLWIFDAYNGKTRSIIISKDPENPISGKAPIISELIDYDSFCDYDNKDVTEHKSITAKDLNKLLKNHDTSNSYILIDVREPFERNAGHIGGQHVPVDKAKDFIPESEVRKVIVYCRSGQRSANVIAEIGDKFPQVEWFNLKGGLLSWQKEIDGKLKVV